MLMIQLREAIGSVIKMLCNIITIIDIICVKRHLLQFWSWRVMECLLAEPKKGKSTKEPSEVNLSNVR
jgi:hypothetical protein